MAAVRPARALVLWLLLSAPLLAEGELTRYVPPTGDKSGVSDLVNIQAACDAPGVTTVLLNGAYYVAGTLRLDDRLLTGVTMPQLTKPVRDSITFVGRGQFPDRALLVGHHARVARLILNASHRCRGLILHRDATLTLLEDVIVINTIRVGVDCVECWGGTVRGLLIANSTGIALRTHRCNQFRCYDLVIAKPTADQWPSPGEQLEDLQVSYGEGYVQTPAEDRAIVVLGREGAAQNVCAFLGVGIEPAYCGAYPLISSCTQLLRLEDLRCEGVEATDALILLHNRTPEVDARGNTNVQINGVNVLAKVKPRYLVRCVGYSRDVELAQVATLAHVREALLVCDGGKHYSPEVRHAHVTAGVQLLTTVNGAVIAPVPAPNPNPVKE